MTTLIGVLGPAGAGKSMVAEYLVREYGAVRYSLAAPLKEIAKNVFNFSDEQLYGTQAQKEATDPRYNFSPRWLLQRLGTEGIRKVFGEDIWVSTLLARVQRDNHRIAVCDDVRFVNEATKIRQLVQIKHDARSVVPTPHRSGFVWRLESPWRDSTADASHASEAQWMQCPYDDVIKPTEYGENYLYELVDFACARLGLEKS